MSSQQPFESLLNDQQASNLHCTTRGRDIHIGATGSSGEVQHIQKLSDHIGALFLNDEYSDVSLIVEGQSFRAHRVILAARSGILNIGSLSLKTICAPPLTRVGIQVLK